MNEKRKLCLFIVVIVLSSMLVAQCAPKPEPTVAPSAEKKVLKVGLLSPGPVHDQGWNEVAFNAIKLIEKEMGAQVSYVEIAETPSVVEKAFRDYAEQGYDMIIGHSFSFQDAAEIVAKDYPNTIFLTSGGEKVAANLAPVIFKENEVSYLMGIIGAYMTKSGKALSIAGEEIPAVANPQLGFKTGFETVTGNECTLTYINSWDDIGAGKEAAMAGIAAGADIVVPNANIAGQGAFQAAEEAGILAFGTNMDQSSLAPKTIIASTVYDYPQAYLEIAKEIQSGTFKGGKIIGIGLESEKAAYVAINPEFQDKIPAEAMQKFDDAKKKILSGELVVPGKMIPD